MKYIFKFNILFLSFHFAGLLKYKYLCGGFTTVILTEQLPCLLSFVFVLSCHFKILLSMKVKSLLNIIYDLKEKD